MFAEANQSDAVQITLLVLSFLSATTTAVLAFLTLKINTKADKAAVQVEAVKDAAVLQKQRGEKRDAKIDAVAATVDEVHLLTNSGMKEVKDELRAARDEIRGLQRAATQKAEIDAAKLEAKIDRTDSHVVANGGNLAKDIEIVKTDVKEVKSDVKVVKQAATDKK